MNSNSFIFRNIIIFCFLTYFHGAFSQDINPQLFHYDIEEGLPSSEVYESYQDPSGYIWFTTDRGIARYDGYNFETFTTDDGLHSNTYFRFTPHQNTLYFCAIDGNIDGIRNSKTLSVTSDRNAEIKKIHGWFDILDISEKGNIMVLKSNIGRSYFRFNSQTGEITRFIPAMHRINDTLRISYFNKANVVFRIRQGKDDTISAVVYKKDSTQDQWSALFLDDKVVCRFTGNKFIYSVSPENVTIMNSLVYRDQLWVCTNSGILVFDQNAKQTTHFLKQYEPTSVMSDYEGNLWITTLNKGVLRIPAGYTRQVHVPNVDHIKNKIVCLKKLKNAIVVVTSNGECAFMDPLSEKKLQYWKSQVPIRPYDVTVLNDTIYFYKNRLVYNNGKLKVTLMDQFLPKHGSQWGYGYTSAKFGNGVILSAYHLGVSAWDPQFRYIIDRSTKEFYHKVIHIISEDKDNCLLGTVKGLFRVNIHSLSKVIPVNIPGVNQTIRINRILKDGPYYYLSTMGNGLIITDFKSTRIISENEGLISNIVHTTLFDSLDQLWLATNKGLVRMKTDRKNPLKNQSETFNNYSSNTGLSGNYIIDLLITGDKLWIANNNGLNILNIHKESGKSVAPKMIIEKLISVKRTFTAFPENVIQLAHDENDIRILFTGICFEKPVNSKFYRYRLLSGNGDSGWIHTNEREIQFTNLDPGIYTFEVQASNNNHIWSEPRVIKMEVATHFLRTVWFRLIILGFITLLLFFLIRAYFIRIRNRQQQAQLLQQAVIRQREAELNTLRNQMNPHFVFNALNSIQSLVYKGQFEEASDFLVKFSRLMRDTLEFSKSESISMNNEILFLSNYLNIEKSRFPGLFDFKIVAEKELTEDNVHLPSMLIQPLVENAVKHAFKHASQKGLILIEFRPDPDPGYIHAYISDNGSGIGNFDKTNEGKTHKSFGLQIINERLSLLREKGFHRSELRFEIPAENMSTGIHLIIPSLESS